MNPTTSTILEDRRLHREYYSSVHQVQVTDLHLEQGTITVKFLDGGNPRTIPIPLVGFSAPNQTSEGEKNYLRFSWGVYLPQLDDILLVAFDPMGTAYSLGFSTIDFSVMQRFDDANEPQGGIGWGDSSGKRLRPGDWTFKSARGCAFYMGDRISLTAGSHSIVLDKPQQEVRIQSDLVHQRYGGASESRSGSVRRILVPGVDTTETLIYDTIFGSVAQEHSHYVRRGAITAPTPDGFLMVRTSEGEVVDDLTAQIVPPATLVPELKTALNGTGGRILRMVMDDATGAVPMWTSLVDNLGNWGVSAKTAVGFQWFTPAATWTVLNNTVSWTTASKYDLTVGLDYTITVGGKMAVTVGSTLDLMAAVKATLEAPLICLGTGASDFLIKGTTFNAALSTFLTSAATTFGTLATACGTPPLTPLAASFTDLATAAGALQAALSGTLSTKSMTI